MSTDNLNQFREILSSHGYKLTVARETTFKLLLGHKPQSIGEILDRSAGRPDRVSIYRNLELFEKLGIVHRLYIGWKYKLELSDKFVAHHHHLICLNCGRIIDIKDERHIDNFIRQMAAKFGFEPRQHQFEVEGYCQDCLNSRLSV